jgi:superfamily I DNA/RNA helicase
MHSAKGLEFDNLIILLNESKLCEEDMKRMYYVALTRAKSSELVLAYSRNISSPMEDAYDVVCRANGCTP